MIDLKGKWQIEYSDKTGDKIRGSMNIPGIMQAAGYGFHVTKETEFVSALHDPDWFLREEYETGDENDPLVPFLSRPRRHYVGKVSYSRTLEITEEMSRSELFLFMECVRRKSVLYIDGKLIGSAESYCAPHIIEIGRLSVGLHNLSVEVDNSLFEGMRPDAHTVTDSVGASWNGITGEVFIYTKGELAERYKEFKRYAGCHPRNIKTSDGNFVIDGVPVYIRGTHFGGDFPITGHPSFEKEYYIEIFTRLKEWGFNLVRCHSFCPVEAMFAAADECGIYILAECGMWATFGEGFPTVDLLYKETERILKEFGHHPSFIMLSPSNEPAGDWYKVLRKWVSFARKKDEALGYKGRRLFTAQSGWFYDTDPAHTEGTDFLYFHRSAFGPLKGGTVRNPAGWKGRDYSPSLKGVKLPVICHELGQWCAYPDFSVIDKFTGFLKPSNYRSFEKLAEKNGLLRLNKEMHLASGRNQMRLLKEEFEANYRTKELKGYEYLDVHDYPGQGTALVGIFDAFFEPKAYADKEYFTRFNAEDVLTAAFKSYTVIQGERLYIPVMLSHYSDRLSGRIEVKAELLDGERVLFRETHVFDAPPCGTKTELGNYLINIPLLDNTRILRYRLSLGDYSNSWELFAIKQEEPVHEGFVECHSFNELFTLLDEGNRVLFLPDLSELDYDCTPVNERSTFWNAQMGPKWERATGILCDTGSKFFDCFPSDPSGGFQFAGVLRSGRAFRIPGDFDPLIRVIDDWNRSIPQAFLLEAKVSNGSLLMAAFDKDGSLAPESALFYSALTRYISSTDFNPQRTLDKEALLSVYFPVNRMKTLVSSVKALSGECDNPEAMVFSNPNVVSRAEGKDAYFEIKLNKPVSIKGFVWLSDQRSRMRDEVASEITVELINYSDSSSSKASVKKNFSLKNTVREQRLYLDKPVSADTVRLTVNDIFGRDSKPVYEDGPRGFYKTEKKKEIRASIAAFHLICDEKVKGSNEHFWEKSDEILTKEIDI